MGEIPEIRELLAGRVGEEMALNDRYLNPQMGRILRTLGLDKSWVLPHLFDDTKARVELGYVSRPVAHALADAARSVIATHDDN